MTLLSFEDDAGKQLFWHSSAHVLGQALENEFGAHLCHGPPLEDGGFFYDSWTGDRVISQADFPAIDKEIARIVKENQPYERLEVTKEEGLELFKYNRFKVSMLSHKVPDGARMTVYRCGTLIDPCRGPHLVNTGRVKAMMVTRSSGSYWQGKQDQDQLQRVYGISFPSKEQLKEWQEFQKAAAERDHRKIGTDQELFFFHKLSPGSCFWLPHGTRIYNRLLERIRAEYWKRGYQEVITPNMYNHALWETSGHLANYKENMFSFQVEDQPFALKPMNCPGHCVMFGQRPRTFRELPWRVADFGVLHRNEASGALTGLTRVRRFQQDDAHIFCRVDQIGSEVDGVLSFIQHIYGIFGFRFNLALSTRPEKALGSAELWAKAEGLMAEALNRFGLPWKENPGDGAFYGPKIDIQVFDALNRKHQCATIQLDFQLPIRFDLAYVSENPDEPRENRRPVMIHRAILGSVERFTAILCEHTGGKWPLWVSPRQVIILPISEEHQGAYCETLRQAVHAAGFYTEIDMTPRKIEKKVREAQIAQWNFILVIGAKEQESGTVNVRTRNNEVLGEKKLDDFIKELQQLVLENK